VARVASGFCKIAHPAMIERLVHLSSGGPNENSDGTIDELGMWLVSREPGGGELSRLLRPAHP
jgi:hypothetical protein